MESTSSDGPAVPLLADALEEMMASLIREGHEFRDMAEMAGTAPLDSAAYLAAFDVKAATAFRISLLVDLYRKGKLV